MWVIVQKVFCILISSRRLNLLRFLLIFSCFHTVGTKRNGDIVVIQGAESFTLLAYLFMFSYSWHKEKWGHCSKACGQGRKMRRVVCKQQSKDGSWRTLASSQCNPATKPISVSGCIIRPCYLKWKTNDWGKVCSLVHINI